MSPLVIAGTASRETVSKEWMKAAGTVGAAGAMVTPLVGGQSSKNIYLIIA